MKPGEHPEFYRFPAPAGRSRESSIKLDAQGQFWHEGERMENRRMAQAFASWIRRHPDDDRWILSNDYDWTYFEVEDVAYFVEKLRVDEGSIQLFLNDGSCEELDLSTLTEDPHGALYCSVKNQQFEAKFSPSAQNNLAPTVVEDELGEVFLHFHGKSYRPPLRSVHSSAKHRP